MIWHAKGKAEITIIGVEDKRRSWVLINLLDNLPECLDQYARPIAWELAWYSSLNVDAPVLKATEKAAKLSELAKVAQIVEYIASALDSHSEEHVEAFQENLRAKWGQLTNQIDVALSSGNVKGRDRAAKSAMETVKDIESLLTSANGVFREQFMTAIQG